MDTSKEYINMSKKAVEIQHDELHKGDYIEINEKINLIANTMHYSPADLDNAIWLPRQDQLQEMVEPKEYNSYRFVRKLNEFVDKYNAGELTGNPSMEQLWLAFVMKEKYSKTWNGTDWEVL